MDSRPGPVRHCRSCVSYVYVFSKKNYMEGCSALYRKADVRKLAERKCFVGIPRCLMRLLCSARGSPC